MTEPVTIGIDVGGTKILGLVVDGAGAVLAEAKVPTPRLLPPESTAGAGGDAVVEAIAVVAERLLATVAGRLDVDIVAAAGVGVPGLVDETGTLRFAPNLPGGEGLDVGRRLSQRLSGLRVVVDNDATCAVIGEWVYGAATGATDAVVVTLGTGIGGGLVVRGALGFAGEIGHMVVDPSGPACPCGKRGCWERFASGSGLGRLAREAAHAGRLDEVLRGAGGDPEAIYRQFLNICIVTADADLKGMRKRIAEMAQTWYEEPSVHGKVQFRVSITVAMMDLLTVCRNYGVLVDREMIKYIRSTVLVDGVISRMAPGLDMALALRDVTEEYLYEQSRKKIFSAGGALSLLTDLAIWIKTGPASMVRALELIERRQMTAKTGSLPVEDQQQPLRARAFAGIAVWALVMVFMTLGGSSVAKGNSPFWEIILGTFVTSWTIWLLWLLRRLVPRKERPGL